MTEITNGEIKAIYFSLVLIALMAAFTFFYNLTPIPEQTYDGQTSVSPGTNAESSSWISGLLNVIPRPFNDPILLVLASVIIVPLSAMLSFIGLRFVKDIITKWV